MPVGEVSHDSSCTVPERISFEEDPDWQTSMRMQMEGRVRRAMGRQEQQEVQGPERAPEQAQVQEQVQERVQEVEQQQQEVGQQQQEEGQQEQDVPGDVELEVHSGQQEQLELMEFTMSLEAAEEHVKYAQGYDPSDYQLRKPHLHVLNVEFGPFTLDAAAASDGGNTYLKDYCSKGPNASSSGTPTTEARISTVTHRSSRRPSSWPSLTMYTSKMVQLLQRSSASTLHPQRSRNNWISNPGG